MAGHFIVIEGIDGSGKTTLAAELYKRLLGFCGKAILLRDPGSTDLGGRLRSLLLEKSEVPISPLAETMLFIAAREQMIAELILPQLADGAVVVLDRYIPSTYAYQGASLLGDGRKEDLEELWQLAMGTYRRCRPDRVLYLDLPPELLLKRQTDRDRIVSRGEDYLGRVYQLYGEAMQKLERDDRQRVDRIDASQSAEAVLEQAVSIVLEQPGALPPPGPQPQLLNDPAKLQTIDGSRLVGLPRHEISQLVKRRAKELARNCLAEAIPHNAMQLVEAVNALLASPPSTPVEERRKRLGAFLPRQERSRP